MKNLSLGVLVVVCVLLAIYGFVQRSEAQMSRLVALENATKAMELENLAIERKKEAEVALAQVESQLMLMQEVLANCEKKK